MESRTGTSISKIVRLVKQNKLAIDPTKIDNDLLIDRLKFACDHQLKNEIAFYLTPYLQRLNKHPSNFYAGDFFNILDKLSVNNLRELLVAVLENFPATFDYFQKGKILDYIFIAYPTAIDSLEGNCDNITNRLQLFLKLVAKTSCFSPFFYAKIIGDQVFDIIDNIKNVDPNFKKEILTQALREVLEELKTGHSKYAFNNPALAFRHLCQAGARPDADTLIESLTVECLVVSECLITTGAPISKALVHLHTLLTPDVLQEMPKETAELFFKKGFLLLKEYCRLKLKPFADQLNSVWYRPTALQHLNFFSDDGSRARFTMDHLLQDIKTFIQETLPQLTQISMASDSREKLKQLAHAFKTLTRDILFSLKTLDGLKTRGFQAIFEKLLLNRDRGDGSFVAYHIKDGRYAWQNGYLDAVFISNFAQGLEKFEREELNQQNIVKQPADGKDAALLRPK